MRQPRRTLGESPRPVPRALAWTTRVSSRMLASMLLVLGSASGLTAEPTETASRGRDVTIIAGDDRIIYEIRQNGILRQIRVVPDRGRPYYLVPADPTRAGEDLSTAGRLIPSWTLITF